MARRIVRSSLVTAILVTTLARMVALAAAPGEAQVARGTPQAVYSTGARRRELRREVVRSILRLDVAFVLHETACRGVQQRSVRVPEPALGAGARCPANGWTVSRTGRLRVRASFKIGPAAQSGKCMQPRCIVPSCSSGFCESLLPITTLSFKELTAPIGSTALEISGLGTASVRRLLF
jgi:hypothetical protein